MRKSVLFLIALGLLLLMARDYVKKGRLQKYIDAHPDNAMIQSVQYNWAVLMNLSGREEKALKKYEEIMKRYKKTKYAPLAMAAINDILYAQDKFREAYDQAAEFVEKYPDHEKADLMKKRMQFIQHGY